MLLLSCRGCELHPNASFNDGFSKRGRIRNVLKKSKHSFRGNSKPSESRGISRVQQSKQPGLTSSKPKSSSVRCGENCKSAKRKHDEHGKSSAGESKKSETGQ